MPLPEQLGHIHIMERQMSRIMLTFSETVAAVVVLETLLPFVDHLVATMGPVVELSIEDGTIENNEALAACIPPQITPVITEIVSLPTLAEPVFPMIEDIVHIGMLMSKPPAMLGWELPDRPDYFNG
jgi:hypothetical protein